MKIGTSKGNKDDRVQAIANMSIFEFVFMLHLMSEIFGQTEKLCQALQRGDQDIVNAMSFVSLTNN